jgi:hypothetical protein
VRRGADWVLSTVAGAVARPPRTARAVAELASALAMAAMRRIDFVHLPVPRSAGAAYFAPLARMELQPRTELYLGLIHLRDGVAGARRRIDEAHRVLSRFGVATECGWGRRETETLARLMELHRDVSAPVAERR